MAFRTSPAQGQHPPFSYRFGLFPYTIRQGKKDVRMEGEEESVCAEVDCGN